jgi:uncharacterized OB-fold protein
MSPPYIVAIVELDEQTGLRLTSNLLDCGVDDVAIGMRVTVGFVARHGVWYPVFIPWTAEAGWPARDSSTLLPSAQPPVDHRSS